TCRSVLLDEQTLNRSADRPLLIEQMALRHADAVRLGARHGIEADPLADGMAVQIDGEVGIDEAVAVDAAEDPADAVAEAGGGGDAAQRRGLLAADERHAQADPIGR